MTRTLRRLIAATVLLLVLPLLAGPPAGAAEVHGDDERDVFVGTGGLLLPATVDHGVRREVAGCSGCSWRLTTVCRDPGLGAGFDTQNGCGSVVRGCPQGRRALRAWFRPGGGRWRAIDVVCLDEPLTVRQVGRQVDSLVEEGIPPLNPVTAPMSGAVTQLPVRFDAAQPTGARRWRMPIAGRPVDVEAIPSWRWFFADDGAGPTAAGPIAWHAYGRPGSWQATVVTTWTATFVVDGLGPFPVPEPITQRSELQVVVGEGRAELVPTQPRHPDQGVAQ